MGRSNRWQFPLPRTHCGMLLGNGLLGAMVWGDGDTLRVTLGRADVWDHRGGATWTESMSYANVRALLDADDENKLNDLFRTAPTQPGEPKQPTMLPLGRFEFRWRGTTLLIGKLKMRRGKLLIRISDGQAHHTIKLTMLPDEHVVLMSLPQALRDLEIKRVTSWEYVGEKLSLVSFKPPRMFEQNSITGWTQDLPADPSYCVACQRDDQLITMTVTRGSCAGDAQQHAAETLKNTAENGFENGAARAAQWWKHFWKNAARIQIPNRKLQFLHDYGMYKFAAMTNPLGVPAALQGPWIEEYQLPPWSNDYHFNINVQLCYQPAYHGNALHHLKPLFDMIVKWTDKLRHNAKQFVGVEDGRLLPHAVSDTGEFIPVYWAHSVDQGSTAWVAQMMFRYYRFTMDQNFLRDVAYPFMLGTLHVYQAMLDRDENAQYRMKIGVSPEYFASNGKGFGTNASFQLAALHRLLEDVIDAEIILGVNPDPRWSDLQKNLPKAALIGPAGKKRIAIWEGQDLDESHRHFSHLAGITPFDVLDANDPHWQPVIERSLRHWIARGAGQWCGWSMAWASMIHSHVSNADGAELWLEMFERVFTNEGHGTLYCAKFPGMSLIGMGSMPRAQVRPEIMQIDGGMGATAAIHEMLLHSRRGIHHLFAGAPLSWRNISLSNMRTEGAFLVSARRVAGHVIKVVLHCEADGEFQLANCFAGDVQLHTSENTTQKLSGNVLKIPMKTGQKATLSPAQSPISK